MVVIYRQIYCKYCFIANIADRITDRVADSIDNIANTADRTQYYSSEFKTKRDAKYKSVVIIKHIEFLLKKLWQ